MPDRTAVHIHRVSGCRPSPLAHYLKALGVLRLVSEQVDSKARGWWQDDVFHLATKLDAQQLEEFFLTSYAPTPMLTPWNGGSGFYPKDNKTGLEAIENSTAERFAAYRSALAQARQVVNSRDVKPDKGESKNRVIAECRRCWRGAALQWIDAALALGSDGEPAFPAMLGTGGNDGRLEFTTNFMLRLYSMFNLSHPDACATPNTSAQLKIAIWNDPSPTLESGAIGQFLPGAAGGPNGTTGFSGSFGVNPWDYVLMLEGALVFSSGLARRCQATPLPQAAAPFAVRSSGSGYGSSSDSDAGARGEQWMPLWSQPTSCSELVALLREGRSQINGKTAGRGTDMARAIAKLGVARGIQQFERYGYIERNGLSNLAVPLGRFEVRPRPNQRLLDEVAPWIDRLRQIASDKLAPQSFSRAYRACELAMFNCATRASDDTTRDRRETSIYFLNLLVALGEAENQMLASPKFSADKCLPIGTGNRKLLSPEWLDVVRQDSHEYQLALSLAAQYGPMDSKSRNASVRMHWLPLEVSGMRFDKGESGLNIGPDQAAVGLDLTRASLAIMHRRLLAYNRGISGGRVPLNLIRDHFGADLTDILAFIERKTNDGQILAYARGLMAIRFHENPIRTASWNRETSPLGGLALYGICRLATPVGSLQLPEQQTIDVRCNPVLFRRLSSGDVSGAIQLGYRQLSNVGLRPKLRLATGTQDLGRRLAASLVFGLRANEWTRLALSLTDSQLPSDEKPNELYEVPL
ncbi:MAG: type I-U CRISPR-associated protein Csx17 [Planctomycetaceae bacterium]